MAERKTGRLADSLSPYLRAHAENPVDWYPWGQEAMDKARFEDKPLLLSIGYSACHWCHVMSRESFEDDEIAAIMNTWFVPVKIDREERPDLDMVYIQAVQLTTGRGGWPLHCFALPDGRPFLGGTYFPPERWKMLLERVHELWSTERARIVEAAKDISRGVAAAESVVPEASAKEPENALDTDSGPGMRKSFRILSASFDGIFGGRPGAPKFPMPGLLVSLLEYSELSGDASARNHAELTLDRIAAGGIHDHIGGGFSRYSVDAEWHVPHFEKMLYDNAGLIEAYAKAYLRTPVPLYRKIVRRTFDFCRRELASPDGGFYSARDADSEGVEGKYYTWSRQEVRAALAELPEEDSQLFLSRYSILPEGNWEDGRNIPILRNGKEIPDESNRLDACLRRLFDVRSRRIPPALDDKILTSWNALMIRALSWAHLAFDDGEYLEAARETAGFIEKNLFNSRGELFAVHARGKSAVHGFAADYAFLADALLELYETTFDSRYRDTAEKLVRHLEERFPDPASPLFRFTARDEPALFAAKTEISDNVIPSSNAVAADVFLRLGHMLHNDAYIRRAEAMVAALRHAVVENYGGFYRWASVLTRRAAGPARVSASGPEAAGLLREVRKAFVPEAVFVVEDAGDERIIVCRGRVCSPPAGTPEAAVRTLRETRKKL